jgi:hypothetical protein
VEKKDNKEKFKATCNRVFKNTNNEEILVFKVNEILTLDTSSKTLKNLVDILLKKGYLTKL